MKGLKMVVVLFAALTFAGGCGGGEDESVYLLRKAAEQGDASAQYNLGVMYYKGAGVPKDTSAAVDWYRKAASQGLALAQNRSRVDVCQRRRGGERSPRRCGLVPQGCQSGTRAGAKQTRVDV